MTLDEAIELAMKACKETWDEKTCKQIGDALDKEPCSNAINRHEVISMIYDNKPYFKNDFAQGFFADKIRGLTSVTPEPKTGHCKDCKWWKDSDGAFRRGIRAESKCPINRKEVYEGNGYCFLFEPKTKREEA